MVVNSEDVMNIMGGMENSSGIKLNDHKRKLKNRFEICKKLGQGTYGKVQLGINKETQERVAIKTIKKSKIETEADLIRIRREIQIMSSVQHPNIIHIYEVFENKEKMVLVMEMANGGELYDFLSDKKCLEEHEARRIFRQIATAVFYCHKHKICHRDLKLENILLDENGSAKIADFGLSNVFGGESLLNTFCGSPLYASPEIVKGSPYEGPEVDCWSLGVLLYTLVYGAMPFDGSNFKRLVRQITTGDYYEPKDASRASSLIRSMLTVQPEMRAKIEDICAHWWVNETYSESCLTEAEYLASLTPVRLDLLLGVSPCPKIKETPKIGQMEKPLSIEEIVNEDKPEVNELKKPKDIPKPLQENIKDSIDRNGHINDEKMIESIESESSKKCISPIPSEKVALINEADSGVMIESVHEIEDNKSVESDSQQKLILDLEKAPLESIPLNIGFKCEPESNISINNSIPPSSSTPPPPLPLVHPPVPAVIEQAKLSSPKPEPKVVEEVIEINGKMEETPHTQKTIKEHTPSKDSELEPLSQPEQRDKSPTPPPTPPPLPPLPPPSIEHLKPIEKLKVDLQPLITKGLDEMISLSPENGEEKDQIKDSLDSPRATVSTPEKRENRDSKVIKAAQYWNNFIGDVISKSKSSDVAKGQPKPKKIVSAGVGLKGMNELKTAFENGKESTEKHTQRKSSVGGCNPGLKVTDAKNVFEIKAQQPPTPVIYRRNSLAKDGKKSTWSKPKPRPNTPGLENEMLLQQIKLSQIEPDSKQQPVLEATKTVLSSSPLIQEKQPITSETPKPSQEVKKSKASSTKKVTKDKEGKESQSKHQAPIEEPHKSKVTKSKESKISTIPLEPIKASDPLTEKSPPKVESAIKESTPHVPSFVSTPVNELKPKTIQEGSSLPNSVVTSPPPPLPQPIQELSPVKPTITETAKPVLKQAKSLDGSLTSNINSKSQVELPPLITNDSQIKAKKSAITSPKKAHSLDIAELEDTLINKDESIKPKETKTPGNKPRPSKLSKPKAVQHFENKINSITQPKHVTTGGKKDEDPEVQESRKEKPSKSMGEAPKVPNVVPAKSLIINNSSDLRNESLTHGQTPDVVLKPIEKISNEKSHHSITTEPSVNSPMIENSLKMIGTPIQSKPSLSTSTPPLNKPPPPPPSTPPVLQTPSQIQSPLIKTNAQEKYVPITLERDTIKESSNMESKRVYHIPVQVESPSIINNNEDTQGNYYPTNSLSRRRWGSRKKRMSTGYSDSSMSDDDGSFFQYPSGLQKQISLGKHGLETAPMFRLRKTRPPFTLQRESSFSSDGEDELEDDGFREMTAENLFSTLLTRVKSLTRRIHDEHEEHINKWHQNQRIVNHPLNPGDTHARLERSALRNSIKRLPMNRRPTYDETPLPSTIPSENLDLACGVSVTSKQRSRPGYLPHPNVERIIPINLVNSHDKFEQYNSASPPIKRMSDMILSNDLPFGEEDRQRRVSRFLRPDFYDTPKEDSIYAKMKEIEEEDKKKSRFLKKIQARNASESCDVLSPLSSLSNQDEVIMPLHTPSNGEGCEPIQLRKGRSAELDNISEEDNSNYLLHGRRTTPLLKRGLSESKGRTSPSLFGMDSTLPHSNAKDNLSKMLTRRSISSELFADDFFNHNPRTITRRSISKDLHDTAEDLRLRNTTWNEFEPTSATTPPIANHHRSSRNPLPRHSNSFTRSDWRRTSVPERGKDFKTLPRNYVHFD